MTSKKGRPDKINEGVSFLNRSRNIRIAQVGGTAAAAAAAAAATSNEGAPRSGCAGEGEDPPGGMAPPSLIQPPSPAPVPHRDSQALVALGDYTAAFRTRCSSDGEANAPFSMVSLSTVASQRQPLLLHKLLRKTLKLNLLIRFIM